MACSYDGGVLLAADSRTSTGSYIANRVADKITSLSDNVYILRSGSAADTQAISRYAEHFIVQHEQEKGEQVDVKTAANFVMQMAYNNKNNLQAGMMVCGWDKYGGGQVWGIPLGGSLIKTPYSIGGSGSAYIYGFCDKNFRENMSYEDCREFVVKAVSHAMSRDGSSGGCIRLVNIDITGARKEFIEGRQVPVHFGEMPVETAMAT
eukprot:CAMPEP_0117680986 /NCGR_PEP_ID=MMETSP0804-20121206/18692_1 /TAXON_ID=1074897 /ORGANISM="Tetraselmis astigmatica, Strain CCMP880" /LENGTH=206 /DNA_ID=CAMNT_0005490615 /DNA_START=136 /DNA_END=756 /DNA_ORIENTATION=-